MLHTLSLILDYKASKLIGSLLLLVAYYYIGDGAVGLYSVFHAFIDGKGFDGASCYYFICSIAVGWYLYSLAKGLTERFASPVFPDCYLVS